MAKLLGTSSLGTPPDTYLYDLARTGNSFATIGSDDTLRSFDGGLKLVQKVPSAHASISCLASFGQGFATAGRDAAIRIWDSRLQRAAVQFSEPKGNPFSALTSYNHLIAAGTESAKEGLGDVSVLLYDSRHPSAPLRTYVESHTDSITQLAFHPTMANVLLSGSTDGLVSLFDCSVEEEEDALQQVLNPRSAVHCAGFLSEGEVFVVTTDEQLSIHSLSENRAEDDSGIQDFGDVRERLHCAYVSNVVTGAQPLLACGHYGNQTLSLVQLEKSRTWKFGSAIDLPGAHGEEVVRDVMVLDAEKKALSCGEDGNVKVWDLASAVPRAAER